MEEYKFPSPLPPFAISLKCLAHSRNHPFWNWFNDYIVINWESTVYCTGSQSIGASCLAQLVKNLPAMLETWARSLGKEDPLETRNGNPLQYFCLENPMDIGAWQATVHRVTRVRHDLALSFFLSQSMVWGLWGYLKHFQKVQEISFPTAWLYEVHFSLYFNQNMFKWSWQKTPSVFY